MSNDFEGKLYRALAPVEPPKRLYDRMEDKLERMSASAAEELADWELAAMRDPRNWVKPAAAVVVGGAAGAALVVFHLHSKRKQQPRGVRRVAQQGARDLGRAARRINPRG